MYGDAFTDDDEEQVDGARLVSGFWAISEKY